MPKSVMPPIDFFGERRTPEKLARMKRVKRECVKATLCGLGFPHLADELEERYKAEDEQAQNDLSMYFNKNKR